MFHVEHCIAPEALDGYQSLRIRLFHVEHATMLSPAHRIA
jgi:hypothetical protein